MPLRDLSASKNDSSGGITLKLFLKNKNKRHRVTPTHPISITNLGREKCKAITQPRAHIEIIPQRKYTLLSCQVSLSFFKCSISNILS